MLGLGAGVVGTGLGAASSLLVKVKTRRSLSFAMEFSAGLMLSIVSFDLLPEAFQKHHDALTFFGIAVGVLIGFLYSDLIRTRTSLKGIRAAGLSVAIGIALHNFPEGLAIGAGFSSSVALGISLCVVIALHNLPEGLSMALTLRAGGARTGKTILYTALAGVPMGIGAYIGAAAGGISKGMTAFFLGLAGGAMLYVVCADMIPASKEVYKGRFGAFGNIIGFILGILLSSKF
jgi:ZIP family zinc transporter